MLKIEFDPKNPSAALVEWNGVQLGLVKSARVFIDKTDATLCEITFGEYGFDLLPEGLDHETLRIRKEMSDAGNITVRLA